MPNQHEIRFAARFDFDPQDMARLKEQFAQFAAGGIEIPFKIEGKTLSEWVQTLKGSAGGSSTGMGLGGASVVSTPTGASVAGTKSLNDVVYTLDKMVQALAKLTGELSGKISPTGTGGAGIPPTVEAQQAETQIQAKSDFIKFQNATKKTGGIGTGVGGFMSGMFGGGAGLFAGTMGAAAIGTTAAMAVNSLIDMALSYPGKKMQAGAIAGRVTSQDILGTMAGTGFEDVMRRDLATREQATTVGAAARLEQIKSDAQSFKTLLNLLPPVRRAIWAATGGRASTTMGLNLLSGAPQAAFGAGFNESIGMAAQARGPAGGLYGMTQDFLLGPVATLQRSLGGMGAGTQRQQGRRILDYATAFGASPDEVVEATLGASMFGKRSATDSPIAAQLLRTSLASGISLSSQSQGLMGFSGASGRGGSALADATMMQDAIAVGMKRGFDGSILGGMLLSTLSSLQQKFGQGFGAVGLKRADELVGIATAAGFQGPAALQAAATFGEQEEIRMGKAQGFAEMAQYMGGQAAINRSPEVQKWMAKSPVTAVAFRKNLNKLTPANKEFYEKQLVSAGVPAAAAKRFIADVAASQKTSYIRYNPMGGDVMADKIERGEELSADETMRLQAIEDTDIVSATGRGGMLTAKAPVISEKEAQRNRNIAAVEANTATARQAQALQAKTLGVAFDREYEETVKGVETPLKNFNATLVIMNGALIDGASSFDTMTTAIKALTVQTKNLNKEIGHETGIPIPSGKHQPKGASGSW